MTSQADLWDEYRAQNPALPPATLTDSARHERTLCIAREFGKVTGDRFGDCLWWAFCHGKALEMWAQVRLLYDSTTAADIPTTARMVGGYCDGIYRWSDQDWARFPDAVKVRIAVNPNTNDGHVGDVEWQDMTPSSSLGWVMRRRAAGIDPTLYCTWGAMSDIAQVFNGAGVPEPHYWIATLDGRQIPLGGSIVANQYAGSSLSGGHYDLSIVADYWPGVDPQGGDVTPDELKQAIRDVLDEGTPAGGSSWRGGNIDTAHKVDVLYHQLAEAVAMGQTDAKGTVIDTHDKVDKVYHALLDPNGAVATLALVLAHLDTLAATSDPAVLAVVQGIRAKIEQHFK